MAGTISAGNTTCHGRLRFKIEILASWRRVNFLLVILLLGCFSRSCYAAESSSSLGFTIHHRFSDAVRTIFPAGEGEFLPEKGTFDYFTAMTERDRIHGRRLTSGNTYSDPLTFIAGNTTFRLPFFGFLYYANVSVGTPGLDFLVALDTGSDLFWLPCDCYSCISGVKTSGGEINFNIYELNTSSTGKEVPCTSSLCEQRSSCVLPSQCPYETLYLSSNTSSSGYLVEDVLQLTTDLDPSKPVDANITFGCGQRQTGSFLSGGAPNGLFGLGMGKVSVPSVLASKNITANSFSMCFGNDGVGRISFGDKGSSDQAETPFNFDQSLKRYNVSITQVIVGKNTSNVDINAIFDSGTSFTILSDPSYTIMTEALNSQIKDKRFKPSTSSLPFEFCYELSSCKQNISTPLINLTMEGEVNYNVIDPFVAASNSDESQCIYCLGIVKDQSINIIGENFMTGYRIVFDREKLVLGWEESDCNYSFDSVSSPPKTSLLSPQSSPTIPSTLDPEAAPTSTNPSKDSGGHSAQMQNWASALFCVAIVVVATF